MLLLGLGIGISLLGLTDLNTIGLRQFTVNPNLVNIWGRASIFSYPVCNAIQTC